MVAGMSDYRHKRHNVSSLLYHIVCPAKYRRAIFDPEVDTVLRDICLDIAQRYEIAFLEIGTDKDHVHFLVQSVPNYSPTKIVQIIKSLTAREIFHRVPTVKKRRWGGEFWSKGYFISTVGRHGNEEVIREYVRQQGSEKIHIPPNYVVERVRRLSKATRGENLQVEHPICGRDASAFHCHPTVAGVLGSTLIRRHIVQVGEPREERLLAAMWVMKAFHGEQFPLQGVVRLIQQRAGDGHPGIYEYRIPACLLVLKPASHTRAIGHPSRGGDVIHKVAEPLTERNRSQAFALSHPVEQGVKLGA
jgi:REP element-mobilizing transposase RayT